MKHPRRLKTHESEGRGGGAEKAAETEEAKMAVGDLNLIVKEKQERII